MDGSGWQQQRQPLPQAQQRHGPRGGAGGQGGRPLPPQELWQLQCSESMRQLAHRILHPHQLHRFQVMPSGRAGDGGGVQVCARGAGQAHSQGWLDPYVASPGHRIPCRIDRLCGVYIPYKYSKQYGFGQPYSRLMVRCAAAPPLLVLPLLLFAASCGQKGRVEGLIVLPSTSLCTTHRAAVPR